jgi:hypothetical protein
LTSKIKYAIIRTQRARAEAVRGCRPETDERHKPRIRNPDNIHQKGSPEMVERPEREKGSPKKFKNFEKKFLTNSTTCAIIKTQRARGRQPESNRLTHESR